MVTPNSSSKIVNLSDFSTERAALYALASSRISSNLMNRINFDIHDNYKLQENLVKDRLDAITNKFRKCEMTFHLYFDELDHDVLVSRSTNLPIMRERIFQSNGGIIKQYFEVDDRSLYQELIDYHFQEFILFTSSVLENLVYLSETLIKKVSIHPKKSPPLSIPMKNFMELLEFLHRLNYRNPTDPVASCLKLHEPFLNRYLPTINTFRNRYIHGFSKKLASDSYEYVLIDPEAPITSGSIDIAITAFTKNIIDNLKQFIPDFFASITATVNAATEIPA
ncbi:MAG: hypothetical protein ABIN91_18655 [Mucilaginibacter sp.]|uniref:hypothetical protein n=1 Tax=Mucilaginibacter sp. TaxID=1882438 RepID=UPI0032652F17